MSLKTNQASNIGSLFFALILFTLAVEPCHVSKYKAVMTEATQSSGKDSTCSSSLDFPFLQDEETVKYIKRSKVMFIIRGLPGSGKSHLAKAISKTYSNSVICCADNFRPPDVKYPFPKEILTTSHKRCQAITEDAAKVGTNVIVVDNSNLRPFEMQPYLTVAKEYNYTEVVVEPKTRWKWNPAELATKTTQGVPKEIIQEKLKLLDQIYPYFYAWFVNYEDSQSMRQVAERVYGECLEQPKFVQEFLQYVVPDAPRTENGSVDLKHYFSSKDFEVGPILLHCTAFYSDQGKRDGSKQYASQPAVQCSLGKAYKLQIIGFLITPRSFGARLKLDKKELLLWNNDDAGNIPTPPPPTTSTEELEEQMEQMTFDPKEEGQCPHWHPSDFSPTCGRGSRAHLSVGTAVGYSAVQTGMDLVQLVQDELDAAAEGKTDFLTVHIKSGKARCYGEGNWLVYLDKPLNVEALYSGYY